MKFGLFIALLVLLASINVFGQDSTGLKKGSGRKPASGVVGDLGTNEDDVTDDRVDKVPSGRVKKVQTKVEGNPESITTQVKSGGGTVTTVVKPGSSIVSEKTVLVGSGKTDEEQFPESLDHEESKTKHPEQLDHEESKIKHPEQLDREESKIKHPEQLDREESNIKTSEKHDEAVPEDEEEEIKKEGKPGSKETGFSEKKPIKESSGEIQDSDPRPLSIKVGKPVVELSHLNDKVVHVRGKILLVTYTSSRIETVKYEIGSARFGTGRPITPVKTLFARDFIARQSRVTLYVSTTKTIDPKLAFAQFPIKFHENNFPLEFNVDVELPDQQRGLLQHADITLYFFVYIKNVETHIDTFLPAGTSQILLQGTNRLVQKLDVYVRASGIEISGLFRGRFGSKYIRSSTSFQVYIVPEQSLLLLREPSFESVAQLTLNNLPAMLPVPFSILVRNQMLKANTKYFAVAYFFENGVRRLLNQEPIWVINEQKVVVTPQVIFNVIPSPFMLVGSVTRSMPGLYNLQPRSTLILRIQEVGSSSPDIIFKLPDIVALPQPFQVNVTSVSRFDSSKNYVVSAIILDEKNNVYMATSVPIPLLDDFSKLILPVDDLLYYVSVRLQSSANQPLSYVPGSSVRVLVSESPEAPSKPIVSLRIDSISADFREFQLQVPSTAIVRGKSYYLIMIVEINGMITQVAKTLLISNNQPPPLTIQLPVLSLNLITGHIFDVENRPSQWSSSSYATLYLLDSKIENPEKAVVQTWKIHLENDFPIRFEVLLDFNRILPNRIYRLQAAIENGRSLLEYKPAGGVLVINPVGGIVTDVRIPVANVKTFQLVKGKIFINDFEGPLPEKGEIVVQLSSSPSLMNPSVIEEIRLQVEGRTLPIEFTMKLPLTKIDINAVYYFLVRYSVRDTVIIPVSQAFAFSPRNEAIVTITLSKTAQIPIIGKVMSTGGRLNLPTGAILHLYITSDLNEEKPLIHSEVFLEASTNNVYDFTMNVDSLVVRRKGALYLRADILYKNRIILSIPRPALLQITLGAQWNINLVIDLPTVIVGRIISINEITKFGGNLDAQIEIFDIVTKKVVIVRRLRLGAKLPQDIRIVIDNGLFRNDRELQARAIVKNCKGQVIFKSGNTVNIKIGLNVDVSLSIVITDQTKLTELEETIDEVAAMKLGKWSVSAMGTRAEFNLDTILPIAVDVVQK